MKLPIFVILFAIIFWSLVFNLAKAQPGPIQTQEAGISNYQIQAITPTTTPVTGKQYLYNANDVLSTKDALNNVQRVNKNYDNYVLNFDVEQGFTSFAGIGTLNTTTPLEGLKSLNLDTTALNDFAETALVTIPRILMGQVCMAKINIKGADANLQFQVVNGAGTIIGFKQLSPFADSIPQFITFNCPNQAAVTATPALGQLKIKITQSTATNAALATLDSFYLGRFESNTMTVQEQPEYYVYNSPAGVMAAGDFAFPAATIAKNSGTLFTTTSNKITALKPSKIFISAIASIYGAGAASQPLLQIYCTINGTETRIANGNQTGIPAATGNSTLTSGQIDLNVGDSCRVNLTLNGANATNNGYTINITATPLPQLATIVNTNTPRAGFWASKNWPNPGVAGCDWGGAGAAFVDFSAVAACGSGVRVFGGHAIPDAASDGQLPQITLSKYPKGRYAITVTNLGATGSSAVLYRVTDGTAVSGAGLIGATNEVDSPASTFYLDNLTDSTNKIIKLQKLVSAGNSVIHSNNLYYGFSFNIQYLPDLSDPYSIPELYAALPPQVINSSGKIWRTESCYITNNGTAAMASSSCNTWVQSVSRTALGQVTINLIANTFSSNPSCTTNSSQNRTVAILTPSPTQVTTSCFVTQLSGTNSDDNFYINCQGFTN